MKIEIFGPGCQRCRLTEDHVHRALESLGLEAEVTHVSDPRELARRGVLFTPALIIDGKIKASGRVPEIDQIQQWLKEPRAA